MMPTASTSPNRHPFRMLRRLAMALLPLAACAGIAAVTSTTPTGFAVRFVVVAGAVALGAWCAIVWGATFEVLGEDRRDS